MNLKSQIAHYMKALCSTVAIGVCISLQIRILHTKHFFACRLKEKQKYHVIFKTTAIYAI